MGREEGNGSMMRWLEHMGWCRWDWVDVKLVKDGGVDTCIEKVRSDSRE